MKKFSLFCIAIFLQVSSLSLAMHHNDEVRYTASAACGELKIFETRLTMKIFSEILRKNGFQTIKKLEILDSKIDPELLIRVPAGLEELSLNSVRDLFGNILSIRDFLTNKDCLKDLKILSLKNQNVNDSEMPVIAEIGKIRKLDLFDNQISVDGVVPFVQIVLARNQGRMDIIARMASMFKNQNLNIDESRVREILGGIEDLSLGSNEIGEAGALSLSQMMGITSLDLSSNKIGDAGVNHISQMIGVKNLNLSSNGIGESGARSLSRMNGITSLDITRVSSFL